MRIPQVLETTPLVLEAVESENVVLADETEAQPADEASADDDEELADGALG